MLIAAYNSPSITLAIDELDSGIYEYLLGELLRIMQKSGKGQLIFTSHNLYPLETLESNSIVFTTTNPSARYTRIKSVRATNNLRSMYLREVILGSDDDVSLKKKPTEPETAKEMEGGWRGGRFFLWGGILGGGQKEGYALYRRGANR